LKAAGIAEDGKGPLFRSSIGKTGTLTATLMNRVDAYRMIRRRTADAGFKVKMAAMCSGRPGSRPTSRPAATLENARAIAAHESPRTTKLYDRTGDEITLDEVERIRI
jgi:hypothetical protein